VSVQVLICTWGDLGWRDLAYARAYPSAFDQAMTFIHHVPDGNAASARNEAVELQARDAEWLCFLDADDELAPGYVDAMRASGLLEPRRAVLAAPAEFASGTKLPAGEPVTVEETTVGLIAHCQRTCQVWAAAPEEFADLEPERLLVPAMQVVYPSGAEQVPELPNRHEPMETLNHAVIGTLVRRKLFERVGGFRDLPAYEDWDLWLRCLRAGAQMVDVPAAVYRAHVNPDGGRNSQDRVVLQTAYDQIRDEHQAAIAAQPLAGVERLGVPDYMLGRDG